MMFKFTRKPLSLAVLMSFLSACGGGSSGGDTETSTPAPSPTESEFRLDVSDAPVDEASAVVIYFTEVELTGEDGKTTFTVENDEGGPLSVDLLNYQGDDFTTLINGEMIPAGEYSQLRLVVTDDSYIEMNLGTLPLEVPSGELKLDGFTTVAGEMAAYTVEFDLRKSLVDPVGQQKIFLKPRGVRLVANNEVGIISGTVAEETLLAESCLVKEDTSVGNAVYVYEGADLTLEQLDDDNEGTGQTDLVQPYATAAVSFDEESGLYQYQAAYLPEGDYTVAFSCLASFDEPESDETEEDGFALQSVGYTSVTAGETSTLDF